MKAYTPENLVKISRYKKLFPTLPEEVRQDVYSRMLVLLKEEEKWCDRGNYKHIAQILTTIALYDVGRPDAGILPEDGPAVLFPSDDEKDPALRIPARQRRRLAIHLAPGGGSERPVPL